MAGSSMEVTPQELLFIVYNRQLSYIINAVDKYGVRLPNFELTLEHASYPGGMGFTGLGSRLYMIGGYTMDDDDCDDVDENDPYSLNVYILDVAQFPSFIGRDPKTLTVMGPKLKGRKILPILFVARGCIYALSSELKGDGPNFEVLYPSQATWTVLPEPPIVQTGRRGYCITSYAFNNDKDIIIYVPDGGGVYIFNVIQPTKWLHLNMLDFYFDGNVISTCNDGTSHYYAFSRGCDEKMSLDNLLVSDDVMKPLCGVVKIRPPLSKVDICEETKLTNVGERLFVVRCGFAKVLQYHKGVDCNIVIHSFEVSKRRDRHNCIVKYVAVNKKSTYFIVEENVRPPTGVILYCVPLSI